MMPHMVVTGEEKTAILACRGKGYALLSPREEQILSLLKAGFGTHKKLAKALFVSAGTTKVYLSRMYSKLRACGYQMDSMIDLLAWAFARDAGKLETYRTVKIATLPASTAIHVARRSA